MRRWVLMAVTVLGVVACGGPSDDELVVFAAASLTDAFTEIGAAYESADGGVPVVFNFAGSSDLAAQLVEGAPADVFASADVANMAEVDAAGALGARPRRFATNRAEIIVEPGNPEGLVGLDGLDSPGLLVVVCAVEVPCGAYTSTILERAGVDLTPASYEANVKAVVTKVRLGEADAGIVYATDVAAAGDAVEGIPIADELNETAEYPIAPTADADAGAADFVEFVLGTTGRDILARHGFGAP